MRGSDARTYVLLGDGEMAEGSVWEAAQLAGHDGLDNLVAIVDVNGLGPVADRRCWATTSRLPRRLAAFGWRAIVVDGHDLGAIVPTRCSGAGRAGDRPTAIVARTVKGQGRRRHRGQARAGTGSRCRRATPSA